MQAYFKSRDAGFECKDSLNPIVTATQCFDDLLIPPDHQSRRASDTYYLTKVSPAPLLFRAASRFSTSHAGGTHLSNHIRFGRVLTTPKFLRTLFCAHTPQPTRPS